MRRKKRIDFIDDDIFGTLSSSLAQINNMNNIKIQTTSNIPIINLNNQTMDFNNPIFDFDTSNTYSSNSNIIDTARSMLGKRYKWGASVSNNSVADCSSLTKKAARSIGLNIPRTAQKQYEFFKKNGRITNDIGRAKAGDFVYFNFRNRNKNPVGHTAIISDVKNGSIKVIEASGSHGKVIERWLPASYYKHIVGIGSV